MLIGTAIIRAILTKLGLNSGKDSLDFESITITSFEVTSNINVYCVKGVQSTPDHSRGRLKFLHIPFTIYL